MEKTSAAGEPLDRSYCEGVTGSAALNSSQSQSHLKTNYEDGNLVFSQRVSFKCGEGGAVATEK